MKKLPLPKKKPGVDTAPRGSFGGTWIAALVLAVATLVAFHPVLFAGFVNWDDDLYVYENPQLLNGVGGSPLHWALTDSADGNWIPLTRLSLLVDFKVFGLRHPAGFHLTSLLLHVLNVLLAFVLFLRWTGQPGRSWVAAALFALHPLRVESVAWVAERKDVLSVFFGLLALLAYGRYVARPGLGRYLAVLLAFVLSLLAKPMLVTLPFLLLLLDYWPLRRWRPAGPPAPGSGPAPLPASWRRLLAEKIPLLAVAAAFSVLTFYVQNQHKAVAPLDVYPLTARVANAIVSYVRYVRMSFFPLDLAPFYPNLPENIVAWRVALALVVLAAVTALTLRQATRRPALLVGWFWFLGTLVPVIGLVQVGNQALADRYTYFPSLGLALAMTWCAADALESLAWPLGWQAVLAGVLLLACAAGTMAQTYCWHDGIALWTAALRATNGNVLAHIKLGDALLDQGRWQDALRQSSQALAIHPISRKGHARALCNYGSALERLDRLPEALSSLTAACELDPSNATSHVSKGLVLEKMQRFPEALASYESASTLDPSSGKAHFNQGNVLTRLGRTAEAVQQYQVALALNPNHANAAFMLAQAQMSLGIRQGDKGLSQLEDAVASYQNALRLNRAPPVCKAFGLTLLQLHRYEEAAQMFEEAVRLAPADREASKMLAVVRAQLSSAGQAPVKEPPRH